jgi:hypothetical protein
MPPLSGLGLCELPILLREMDRTFWRSSGRCHIRNVYELFMLRKCIIKALFVWFVAPFR